MWICSSLGRRGQVVELACERLPLCRALGMVLLLQFAEWLGDVKSHLSTAVEALQLPGTKREVREVVGG